jgi:hypothetical protein
VTNSYPTVIITSPQADSICRTQDSGREAGEAEIPSPTLRGLLRKTVGELEPLFDHCQYRCEGNARFVTEEPGRSLLRHGWRDRHWGRLYPQARGHDGATTGLAGNFTAGCPRLLPQPTGTHRRFLQGDCPSAGGLEPPPQHGQAALADGNAR